MRKVWLVLLVLASATLYFWLGHDDSNESQSQPPVAASKSGRPPVATASPGVQPWAPQKRSGSWEEVGAAYKRPAPTADTAWMYGIYSAPQAYSPEPLGTQDYQFRPLTQSEKAKLEERLLSPQAAVPAEPTYRTGPSTGYPAGGYAVSGYPNTAIPSATYPSPRAKEARPTATYRFREFDSEKASKRWTGNYPPPAEPLPQGLPDQSAPYAPSWSPPGWNPPVPYQQQRRPQPIEGPLWAAEGLMR